MPFCTGCGTRAIDAAKFCSHCGQALGSIPSSPILLNVGASTSSDCLETLEALEPEFTDTKNFLQLCENSPSEALAKIAMLEACAPDLAKLFPVPVFMLFALVRKTLEIYKAHGEKYDAQVRGLCTESLLAYSGAQTTARDADSEEVITELQPQFDAVAILVERNEPGRVQELLAETRLKYAAFADRVNVADAVKINLPNDKMREVLELPINPPFVFRAALFAALLGTRGSEHLVIALYEQTDVWTPSGEKNPIKGQLHLTKDASPGSKWEARYL